MLKFATFMIILTDFDAFWVATKGKNGGGYYALRDFTGDSFAQENVFVGKEFVKASYSPESIAFSINIDGDGDNSLMQRRKSRIINAIFSSSEVKIGIFTPQQGWVMKKILPTRWDGLQYSPYATDDNLTVSIEADAVSGEWETLPLRSNEVLEKPGTFNAKIILPKKALDTYPTVHLVIKRPVGTVSIRDSQGVAVTLPDIPSDTTFVVVRLDPSERSVLFDGTPTAWRDGNFAKADFTMKAGENAISVTVDGADNGEAEADIEVRASVKTRVAL